MWLQGEESTDYDCSHEPEDDPQPRAVMELNDISGRAEGAPFIPFYETARKRLAGQRTLFRFVVVGAVGYLIYQIGLFIMYDSPLLWFLPAKDTGASLILFTHGDLRLLITSLLAAELSIVGAFAGHNRWTFRSRQVVYNSLWLRFSKYNVKAVVSSIGILTVVVNVLSVQFGLYHVIAAPLGVLMAFTWNWLWDAQYIWRQAKRADEAA